MRSSSARRGYLDTRPRLRRSSMPTPELGTFSIVVYGSPYDVVNGLVKMPNRGLKPKLYKQLARVHEARPGEYVLELAMDMMKRIEEDVVDIQAERVRRPACPLLQPPACYQRAHPLFVSRAQARAKAALEAMSITEQTRSASSAYTSPRPTRRLGEANKASPHTAAAFESAPVAKRRQSSSRQPPPQSPTAGSHGSKQLSAAGVTFTPSL